ncbi:hypothetical protein [Nocardia arthritidis]|uniref:Uncharacterized protein n=1 Tax=Nocardia arthritidis TaxID=228602 RepID=A0A6G9YKT7_9NOCA|nr:hypothetical protein [Nocardia arthritidis]QIS13646.1 hypothetical protein F5544_29005 [Nocardia arthritidis]
MPETADEPIRYSPAELQERLYRMYDDLSTFRHELTALRHDYEVLGAHPDAIEMADPHSTIAPAEVTGRTLDDLKTADNRLKYAAEWLVFARGSNFDRIQLTTAAAVELSDRRRAERAPIQRSR